MTTRNIGMNVQARTPEEWTASFALVAALVERFGGNDQYVSVWSDVTDREVDEGDVGETLTYNDQTINKVREALKNGLLTQDFLASSVDVYITDLISKMQNAGILFRERL